jgi:hypothetical protein
MGLWKPWLVETLASAARLWKFLHVSHGKVDQSRESLLLRL